MCGNGYHFKLAEYRESLAEYLKNRMNAVAPNLTVMLGELVGARLISHAGSIVNLAKYISFLFNLYHSLLKIN